jgi:signal transduction histidine kinase
VRVNGLVIDIVGRISVFEQRLLLGFFNTNRGGEFPCLPLPACTTPPPFSARTMGNALRLFVFLLALTAVGATAALTQLWVKHRAVARQHASAEPPAPIALRACQRDQQNAVGLIVTVSLLSLLAVALVGGARPATSISETAQKARQEMQQVEHLAKTNVAQEAALGLERAERRRADENLQLQQLLLNEVLAEKIRLGRDLHDGVIQSLYATGLTLESARQKQGVDPAAADVLFDRGIELLNQSIRQIRGYIQPTSEAPEGMPLSFAKAVDVLVADLKGERDVSFLVRIDESAESRLAASQLADTLQIVREAVSNALRHGSASQIQIRLHEEGAQLALMIQDNGSGFDATAKGSGGGNGLTNFRARAGSLGAALKLDSRPGHGTRVVLTIPTLNHS